MARFIECHNGRRLVQSGPKPLVLELTVAQVLHTPSISHPTKRQNTPLVETKEAVTSTILLQQVRDSTGFYSETCG